MTKQFYLSKTFWANVLILASMLFPVVKDWVAANPETFTSVWASANILLRFFTAGRVTLLSGDDSNGTNSTGSGLPLLMIGLCTAAALIGLSQPSCTSSQLAAFQSVPVKGCITSHGATVCYSTTTGVEFTVDADSSK